MAEYLSTKQTKITVNTLIKMKQCGEKIAILTAYDCKFHLLGTVHFAVRVLLKSVLAP